MIRSISSKSILRSLQRRLSAPQDGTIVIEAKYQMAKVASFKTNNIRKNEKVKMIGNKITRCIYRTARRWSDMNFNWVAAFELDRNGVLTEYAARIYIYIYKENQVCPVRASYPHNG